MRDTMRQWNGTHIQVKILYTRAGVAQTIWLAHKNAVLLIDTGDGALRDLLVHKLHPRNINGILYTHGHFDHIGGIHSLLGFMRMVQRTEILRIYVPEKCREIQLLIKAFKNLYRKTIPFTIKLTPLKPHALFRVAGMTVKAYPVVHHGSIDGAGILGPIPALGYRITYKKESVAITGDTGFCPSLKPLVQGADLAIIEATYKKARGKAEYLKKVHLSEQLAKKLGKTAKKFILVHKATRT
jgi:ribonuclease BN (tRNA processing enzyme)